MKKKVPLKILITGGTIDDLEYESEKDAPENSRSYIPDAVKQRGLSDSCTKEVVMMKDSRHVTDSDRKVIADRCTTVPEEKIIITHGTFTMPDTAKYLGKLHIPKTIVLTGAAIPINKKETDGYKNLQEAIVAAQQKPHGVYIAMNDRVFNWDNVQKNLDTGMFEEEEI